MYVRQPLHFFNNKILFRNHTKGPKKASLKFKVKDSLDDHIMTMFCKKIAEENKSLEDHFIESLREDQFEITKLMIQYKLVDINAPDENGVTALQFAKTFSPMWVKILIANGTKE